jgi:hypothetical protein
VWQLAHRSRSLVVHQVVVRRASFGAEIDVTAIAVAQRPLVTVLVASEAGGHLREHALRASLGHRRVAAHAVAAYRPHVLRMLEAKVGARELCRLSHVRLAVAALARAWVVRLLVAATAGSVGRKVQRSRLAGRGHVDVALDAVDALEDVGAMLERVRWRLAAKAQHAGARRERERLEHDEAEADPHRGTWPGAAPSRDVPPNASDRRTSASAS